MYSSSSIVRAAKLTLYLLIITWKNVVQCQIASSTIRNPSSAPIDLRLARSLIGQPVITTLVPPSLQQETPDFTEPIGNHTVALGRDAQLSCKISNLGNFRTAWLRVEDKGILTIHNNIITRNYRIGLTNNDDGRNFVLTIKNVQPSDKGGYMCQINSVPMKYAIGYLDVLTPPVFDDQPPGEQGGQPQQQGTSVITVAEGGNASLSCRATGHPSPVITWRREDNEPILLNGAAVEGVAKSEGASITLSSVSRLSSGAYLCIASNNVQPSASKRQVLDVQYRPVVRLPQTELAGQLAQAALRLTCHIELNPLGTYHWVKLSQQQATNRQQAASEDDLSLIEHDELINSDKFEIVIKQVAKEKVQMTLAIRQIERQDFAWYKCIARNSLGTQSNSIRLYESSSFSLNNMFRGSPNSDSSSQQQQQQQPPESTSDSRHQHLNDQQDTGGPGEGARSANKPILATRTHTRSSWVQRSSGRGGQDQTANAVFDSSSGSTAGGHQFGCQNLAAILLLLLSNFYLLASVAQTVDVVVDATGHCTARVR